MTHSYSGVCKVEDDEFQMKAERLIIRDNNEIAFHFLGTCEMEYEGEYRKEEFDIEGIAKKTEHGFYMAPKCELKYLHDNDEYDASIKFTKIEPDKSDQNCKIEGLWIQDGEEWNFSGKLEKFKTQLN